MARLFREISDLAIVHRGRQDVVFGWLDVVLPCMRQTMKDIKWKLAEMEKTWKRRWQEIDADMVVEAGGTTLRGRFEAYGLVLVQIARLLSR